MPLSPGPRRKSEKTEETTAVAIIHEDEFSVSQVKAQIEKIAIVMKETMKENEHYGVIPGTNGSRYCSKLVLKSSP